MKIQDYIDRINYKGDLTPNLEVLKQIQKAHTLNVPFENLDIHYDNPISLDIDKFYNKVVEKGRGGFCYELNGLFHTLLKTIGFDSKIISARVYDNKKEDFGREYDHLAIIIKLNQVEYLVDVGFGEFTFHPLELKIGSIQSDPRGNFIIEQFENEYYKVSKINGEIKSGEYIFTNRKRELNEFSEMCNYHQTDSNSHFTQKKLISKPTEMGRVTITGNTFKVSEGGETIKEYEFPKEEFGKYLMDWFDLDELQIKATNIE
ncbi:arylamine N-acetyltransferase [Fulvivirgaceae bacterium BMA10]|uniref:Arylamine N-acetyltransferase n=1 Tax=Splendidivirga corallicola TaxID=3051826 RepID=A0ABT8KLU7_9BACT|nr:arylamine N-acetyltransferase [Fulvivirgaceae bacterium BMA10]